MERVHKDDFHFDKGCLVSALPERLLCFLLNDWAVHWSINGTTSDDETLAGFAHGGEIVAVPGGSGRIWRATRRAYSRFATARGASCLRLLIRSAAPSQLPITTLVPFLWRLGWLASLGLDEWSVR